MHPVTLIRRGPGGRPIESLDRTGGVFVPSASRRLTQPVYSYGFPDAKDKDPIFTCPVSAIPDAVWELYALWRECRALHALPLPGGVVDQPLSVRRSFPTFDSLAAIEDQQRQAIAQATTTAAVLKAVLGGTS